MRLSVIDSLGRALGSVSLYGRPGKIIHGGFALDGQITITMDGSGTPHALRLADEDGTVRCDNGWLKSDSKGKHLKPGDIITLDEFFTITLSPDVILSENPRSPRHVFG